MSEFQTIGVVGAGTMGNGIAHVFARSGIEVRLCEVEQRFLDRGLDTIRKNMAREVAKSKLTQPEMDAALARILRGCRTIPASTARRQLLPCRLQPAGSRCRGGGRRSVSASW